MKPDEFEQQLKQQPRRAIPAGWRSEILGAAAAAKTPPVRKDAAQISVRASVVMKLWSELVLPCRVVWAGIAAAWLAVLICNYAMKETPKTIATDIEPASEEMMTARRQQQQLLSQLLERPVPIDAEPAQTPRPRSQKREVIALG